jgi:hypothetical protein
VQQLNRILRGLQPGDEGLGHLRGPSLSTRIYKGAVRSEGQSEVWFEDAPPGNSSMVPDRHPLSLQLEVRNHSPTGFAWGYGGSGPAQLALALLVDALGDAELALVHYQEFKREHVSNWGSEWSITAETIQQFVARRSGTPQRVQFSPGAIVATPAALGVVSPDEIRAALQRHLRGDWGEVDRHDWNANNLALLEGTRLLSAYDTSGGERFWIITEADRSVTTVLLPEDY